jgi:hypothetical protein
MKSTTRGSAAMLIYLCTTGLSFASTSDPGGWNRNQLLNPSAGQLKAEQHGRVAIYDGLHESTVDRALDTQFGRIQNMMFVRVTHTTPEGGEWVDDECD